LLWPAPGRPAPPGSRRACWTAGGWGRCGGWRRRKQELDDGLLLACGPAPAVRAGWEAGWARQRARFDAADAVLRATAEAAAARAGGLLQVRHGRSLARAARDRHPTAAAWLAAWEGRLLLARAMAGHPRLCAAAAPRDLSADLLWPVADALSRRPLPHLGRRRRARAARPREARGAEPLGVRAGPHNRPAHTAGRAGGVRSSLRPLPGLWGGNGHAGAT
jgi:hypothetical protein